MSYCRFSSANGMCDVYVYEDVYGGWTTHVAKRRLIFPPIPDISMRWFPDFGGRWDKEKRCIEYPSDMHKRMALFVAGLWSLLRLPHRWSRMLIPMQKIGLAYDGNSFNDPTPFDCAKRLENLAALGYRVPQSAIDALYEDAG